MALAAGYLATRPVPKPLDPPDGACWRIESVMFLGDWGGRTYRLRPPFRVVRGGRPAVYRRGEDEPTLPVVRLDLTIDGEPVTVFTRLANPPAPAGLAGTSDRPASPTD